MARLDWMAFLAAHPAAHLLAARIAPECDASDLKRLRRLLHEVIDGQSPAADYATAIVRHRAATEIQCGFAEQSDADRVGARLGAHVVDTDGSWLSERSLRLDARTERAVAQSCGHVRSRRQDA